MPRLSIPGGPTAELGAQPCVAGRLQSCGLTLEGEGQSSRKHFQVVPQGSRYRVEDLGSRNGTLLNGERIKDPVLLRHGDQLEVGETVVRYESARPPLPPGTTVAGCTLGPCVGRSAYGALYEATQGTLERPVTVELCDPDLAGDPEFQRFYEGRARLGGSFDHPQLRAVFDTKQADGQLLTVFERLPETTLEDELRRRAFDRAEALELLEAVANLLAVVHKQGKHHGTFGPHCLRRDEAGKLKLCELGDEPRLRPHRPDADRLAPYASPEEARGHPAGPPADVYALGILAFRLLEGRLPYAGKPKAVLTEHGSSTPAPMTQGLPPELEELVADLLHKVATQRPTAAEAAERLATIRAGGGAAAKRPGSARKSTGRKPGGSDRLAASSARGRAAPDARRPTSSAEHPRAAARQTPTSGATQTESASQRRVSDPPVVARRPLAHRASGGVEAFDPDPAPVLALRLVLLACGYLLIAVSVAALTRILLRALG
ncbi:MAG: FHA domain-containing protein [Planctomycetota bacterium]